MNLWLMTAVIMILVMFSAFFSSTETAYAAASKIRLKSLADNGNKKAEKALFVMEHYDKALSTILVGNNIVNIATSSLATLMFVSFLGDAVGTIVSTVVITIVVLVCGEVLPKNYAMENCDKICLSSASTLSFLMTVLTPATFLLLKLKDFITIFIDKDKNGIKPPSVTEDELKYIVESIEEEGVLEEQESELVQSALDFDEKTAYDILTPRVDMVAINVEADSSEILKIIVAERYSRIPVYRDNFDNIIGVLHSRDYLEAMLKDPHPELEQLIQPAYFIYRSKKLSSLLADFRYKRLHLAVVTDDYGGTLGIVTMEDLLEQLVGDIWDEDEEIEHKFRQLSSSSYELSGDMNLDDMLELIGENEKFITSDSKSVGGWAIEQIGDIPEKGFAFTYKNLEIKVTDMEDQRINKLVLTILPVKKEE